MMMMFSLSFLLRLAMSKSDFNNYIFFVFWPFTMHGVFQAYAITRQLMALYSAGSV